MSTLYVLSLRAEEDLLESDGYVPGGLATSCHQARWGWAGRPGSEEPWKMSPVKGAPPQDLTPPGVCRGGRWGVRTSPGLAGEAAASLSC